MADDHYSWQHMPHDLAATVLWDEDDELAGWTLPEEDIKVPAHLIPPYQDEEDESTPTWTHPSYPYGNPYMSGGSSSTATRTLPAPVFRPARSLATTLPALAIRELYSATTLGDARERTWDEMATDELFEEDPRKREQEEIADAEKTGDVPPGDIPPPQDQEPPPPTEADGA